MVALLVLVSALADGCKVVSAVESGQRESANDRVLRPPPGTVAAPADDERCGITLRRGPTPHVGHQALHEGRERHDLDLVSTVGREAPLPQAERAAPLCRTFASITYRVGVRVVTATEDSSSAHPQKVAP